MDIQLPSSFAIPLQHLLTKLVPPTIYSDEVLGELYRMLQERMKTEHYQNLSQSPSETGRDIHNECLTILNKLIRKGKLGGTALCEVEDIPNDRVLISIHWAAVRTWTSWEQPRKKTTGIATQKWDATRDFIFTIGDS